MHKRTLLAWIAAAPAAGLLAGCGFRLRGAPAFRFRTLFVQSGAAPAVGRELVRTLEGSGSDLRVLTEAAQLPQAEVVLELQSEQRERVVLSLNAAGQVRELQLRLRLRFRMRGRDGSEWIAPTELLQQRDVSYNESVALSKEGEEQLLYRNMQTDIVQQLMRRMAAAKPHD